MCLDHLFIRLIDLIGRLLTFYAYDSTDAIEYCSKRCLVVKGMNQNVLVFVIATPYAVCHFNPEIWFSLWPPELAN